MTGHTALAGFVAICLATLPLGCGSDDTGGVGTATTTTVADTQTDTGSADDATESSPGDASSTAGTDIDEGAFAYLVVEPEALDFGVFAVGEIQTRDIELENAGDRALTLTSIRFVNGSEVFAVNVDQALVTPGAKKTLKVTFYALSEGSFADVLRFESNAVNGAWLDLPVSAVGSIAACEDADGDLHGVGCPAGPDCNDSDSTVYVGAPEICNGLDDDCDGLHDEDFVGLQSSCLVGFGACIADGFKICAADQMTLQCSVNPVTGGSELCNEIDDDCDGATDEDFPSMSKLCSVGLGACRAVDKFVCSADKTALVCSAIPGEPGIEICGDGIDNDCDGIVDEGELEVCGDEVDNDCDGETDESGSTWGEVFFARNWYGETVAIYPSNGDGTFEDAVPLTFPGTSRYNVAAVGDFDGDRYLDLIVAENQLEGRSICTIDADCAGNTGCKGGVCRPLCTTDAQCTGDDRCIDTNPQSTLATHTYCVAPTRIHLAVSSCDGAGDLALTHLFTLAPGERLGPVIDADGNGHLDFVGMYHWHTKLGFTWMNDGNGGFTKLTPSFDFTTLFGPGANGYWVWGLVKTSKDLNGDGLVDLLGRSFNSGGAPPTSFWFFEGNGDGTFANAVTLGSQVPAPSNLVTANDFDLDGDQDIVAGLDDDGQPGNAWMMLNRNTAEGTSWVTAYSIFDVAPTYNSGGEHPGYGSGTSFDFDGDHRPDILAGWVPEECGSYLWGCRAINDPSHVCYGGNCRKIGYIRNRTADACLPGTSCVDGQCTPGCTADCTGKRCGSDGCGGTCGVCGAGQLCTSGGQCVVDCVPSCDGKSCGDNGCGGICGQCSQGESCLEGACVTGCVPNCAGRRCGDDGCGGQCAVFDDPVIISFDDNASVALEVPTNVPPTRPVLAIEMTDVGMACVILTPSYDLDPVTYRYRWFRDGVFAKDVGETDTVSVDATLAGEVWTCRVRATDGTEWSPTVEVTFTVVAP